MSKALSNIVSSINIGKVSSSTTDLISNSTKKFDASSISKNANISLPTNLVSRNSSTVLTSGKKTSKEFAAEVGEFASHPGASSRLNQVTKAMASNPKLAAAGITTTAAAGFVAFRMAQGATFDEAFGELTEGVKDVVVDTAGFAGGVVGGATDEILKNLLGENYIRYFYGLGIVFVIMILLKIRRFFN